MNNSKTSNTNKVQPLALNIKDNLQDIFQYKKAYQIHVRKLSEIRNVRKNNLKTNTTRNFQIEHIKDIKHNNFMYKLNQQATKISNDNLRIFGKLNKQMNTSRSVNIKQPVSMKARKSMDMTANHNKIERQKIIYQENQKLKQRIKSSQSFLNSSKLMEEQKKRQSIKQRISRFNNSQLKQSDIISRTQRYFSAMTSRDQKQFSFSCKLSDNRGKTFSETEPAVKSTKLNKKSIKISTFYNPRQIIMNRIENFGTNFKIFKNSQEYRPKTSATFKLSRRKQSTSLDRNNKSFFPTQIS